MKTIFSAAAILCFSSMAAFAHADLMSETPKAGATVTAPHALTLHFSENVTLDFTGVTVKGPQGKAVKLGPGKLSDKDQTLNVPIEAPLTAGRYHVAWHALSQDGHHTQGSYDFAVK